MIKVLSQLGHFLLKWFPESQQRFLHHIDLLSQQGRVGNVVTELGTLSPGIKLEFNRIQERKGKMDIGFCHRDSK